jgi:hypothetical protein
MTQPSFLTNLLTVHLCDDVPRPMAAVPRTRIAGSSIA